MNIVDGITANNKIYLTDEGEKYEKSDIWTNGVYAEFHIEVKYLVFLCYFYGEISFINELFYNYATR